MLAFLGISIVNVLPILGFEHQIVIVQPQGHDEIIILGTECGVVREDG
jgi:hypothetical protein